MKYISLILICCTFLIFSCESESGGGILTGDNVDLTTSEDSMYYAFGASVIESFDLPGLNMNPAMFQGGLESGIAETATLDEETMIGYLRELSMEVQSRQGRAVTDTDPVAVNIDSASYAYGLYFSQQLSDIGMDINKNALCAGFADACAGKNALGSEEKSLSFMTQFNQIAQKKAQDAMVAKMEAESGPNKEEGRLFMETNKSEEGVIEHESGMQYKVLKGGGTGESPAVTDMVTIHYEGRLLDGTVFDSSYSRGEPATFPLSNLIRGWQIAMPMMKPGDKWQIYLPSDLAYGDQGSPPNIPPGATLVFDIEFFGIGEAVE